jgi:glycosyltransferase involved in cell wall biosynthesis
MAAKYVKGTRKNALLPFTIPYPHRLLDSLLLFAQRSLIFKKIINRVYKISLLIAQLWYAGFFVIRESKTKIYYVIQTPLVALFFPKKTTVMYHNFYYGLDYIFKILYLFQKDADFTKFVFVSQSLLDQFSKEYPIILRSRCYVLHNSVDTKKFKQYSKKTEKISFIFLSAWVKEKGIHILPKIIEMINKKYKDKVNFIIGGSTNLWSLSEEMYKRYVKTEIRINRLSKNFSNVTIVGLIEHSNIPVLLSSATYCLLPSTWEEPNSLLAKESLACGTPVIAFDLGGNKEIISDNVDGFLVRGKNVKDYIDFLDKLISNFDKDKYLIMSNHAIKNAQRYPLIKRHQKLLDILFS